MSRLRSTYITGGRLLSRMVERSTPSIKRVRGWDERVRRGIKRVFGTKVRKVSQRSPEWLQKNIGDGLGFYVDKSRPGLKAGTYVGRAKRGMKGVVAHEQVHALVDKNKVLSRRVPRQAGGYFEDYVPGNRPNFASGLKLRPIDGRLKKLQADLAATTDSRATFKSIRRKIERAGRYGQHGRLVQYVRIRSTSMTGRLVLYARISLAKIRGWDMRSIQVYP